MGPETRATKWAFWGENMRFSGLLVLALMACDDTTGGGAVDSSPPRGTVDSSTPVDAGVEVDAWAADASASDTGMPDAQEAVEDAGPEEDAAPRPDVGRLQGDLVAEPGILVFTFEAPGGEFFRGAVLSNAGPQPLEIVRLEWEGDPVFGLTEQLQLPLRLASTEQVELVVRYVPDDNQADTGAVTVHQNRGPPARIEMLSERKVANPGEPCLQIRPARLDYGAVPRGDVASRNFDLISCGEVPVTVNAIARGMGLFGPLPDTFQIANPPPFPLLIDSGDTVQIEGTYAPRRANFEAGFWAVRSTDPNSPEQRVEVSAIATPPPLDEIGLHVRLEWDTDLTDVDLHLLGPNGQLWTCEGDCYFSNPQPNWGDPNDFVDDPFLDVDDVDGFGPENINLETPAPGTYRVVVQYWDDHGGDVPESVVEVLSFGQVVGRYGPRRTADTNDVWQVVDIDWPGLALRPVDQLANQARGNLCGGF